MALPLKLVAFERYMLADDRVSHPMTFTVRLKFSGRFDGGAFESAVEVAVGRHPLLNALLSGDHERTLRWTPAPGVKTYIDVAEFDAPLEFPGSEWIDLRTQTGLRIWVRTGPEATEMRLQFHHACCDGIASYRFIEDLLCAYDQAVYPAGGRSKFRPLDTNRLKTRTSFGLSWTRFVLRIPQEIWGIAIGTSTFFFGRPAALCTPNRPTVSEDDKLTLLDYPAHTFDQEMFQRLLAVARETGVTLNDLLLGDMFLAIQTWNSRHDPGTRRRSIRISVPMDLRTAEDRPLPAANVVAMIFLDRRPSIFPSARWLLRAINWEMRFIKAGRMGIAFVRACGLVGLIPGGLKWLTRVNRCYCTAVLSNNGRPLFNSELARQGDKVIAGDLTLEAIESAPPVRPYTAAALACLSYAERFVLAMNYDRNHFTPAAARDLLDTIVGQIRETAGRSSDEASKIEAVAS